MPGLTDRDRRRIERFVRTPPDRRSPRLLVPTTDEGVDDGVPEDGYGDGHGDGEGWDETGG